jgi:hypothetical protein
MDLRTATVVVLLAGAAGCASPPAPTAAALRVQKNSRAVIEGSVRDVAGRPVAGVSVRAMPRSADLPWAAWAPTDAEGRFQLMVYAPGSYGFLLRSGATTVVTPDPRDPARLVVDVRPGEVRSGVEILFLREAWSRITGESSPGH